MCPEYVKSLPIRKIPWRAWRFYFYGKSFVFTPLYWFRPPSHIRSFIYIYMLILSLGSFLYSFIAKSFIHSIICSFSALIHLLIQFHSSVDTFFFFFSFTSLFLYSLARFCPTFIPNRTFLIRFGGLQATLVEPWIIFCSEVSRAKIRMASQA